MAKLPRIKTGWPGVTEQAPRYAWDSRTGWQTTRVFKGTPDVLFGIMPFLQQNGWSFTTDPVADGATYVITATIGFSWNVANVNDNPVDVWELTSNKVSKELLRSDNALVNALLPASGGNPSESALIQSFLETSPAPAIIIGTPKSSPPTLSVNGSIVYTLMSMGQTDDIIFAPTLRHTQTVSNIYSTRPSIIGVGNIFLTSTMQAVLPATVAIALPPDGTIAKNGLVFNYGWLKDSPNITASAFNKTQIVQDWEYGLWSRDAKGTPT